MSRLKEALLQLVDKCTPDGTKPHGDNVDEILACLAAHFEAGGKCEAVTLNIAEHADGGVYTEIKMPKENWSVAYVEVTQSGIGSTTLNFGNGSAYFSNYADGTYRFKIERYIKDTYNVHIVCTSIDYSGELKAEMMQGSNSDNMYWSAGNPAGAPVDVSITITCI